jgi:hypothetical protein
MNRALPPGDRGHRSGDPLGSCGSARAVSRAVGLVCGAADASGRKPPGAGQMPADVRR